DFHVTGVQTCALPICFGPARRAPRPAVGGPRQDDGVRITVDQRRRRLVAQQLALAADLPGRPAARSPEDVVDRLLALHATDAPRSEERRVGKEGAPPE